MAPRVAPHRGGDLVDQRQALLGIQRTAHARLGEQRRDGLARLVHQRRSALQLGAECSARRRLARGASAGGAHLGPAPARRCGSRGRAAAPRHRSRSPRHRGPLDTSIQTSLTLLARSLSRSAGSSRMTASARTDGRAGALQSRAGACQAQGRRGGIFFSMCKLGRRQRLLYRPPGDDERKNRKTAETAAFHPVCEPGSAEVQTGHGRRSPGNVAGSPPAASARRG